MSTEVSEAPHTDVAIIGAGPAGVRVASDLLGLHATCRVCMVGAEDAQPYDRVRLSSLLAGEVAPGALESIGNLAGHPRLDLWLGDEVIAIDRERHALTTRSGRVLRWGHLVLAMGSRAHVPNIAGTDLPGVYRFRDLRDAERLGARRMRSRCTVVLGGGLLGLEAARAMRRHHTRVVVVEHGGRLMPRQLDDEAARLLAEQIHQAGIQTVVDDGAAEILGNGQVEGVRLHSGIRIACDTVIVATGIVPNTRLALDAGLPITRGIRVDDELRTIDPDIFAVGECAEHRGLVYGLVAPCLEQAAVAASLLAGQDARYLGSVNSTRLKVVSTPVFAAGLHPDQAIDGLDEEIAFKDAGGGYRKLLHRRGRLQGVLGIGEWDELPRVLEATGNRRRIGALQLWRFRRTGQLFGNAGASVVDWPATATVCNCTGVTRGELGRAMGQGCATRAELAHCTRASTICGSCAPLLDQMLGGAAKPQAAPGWRVLLVMAAVCALLALPLALLPGLSYAPSWADLSLHWDRIWRDGTFKQISGFSLLGMAVIGLALSLRKRVARVRLGGFGLWRNLHVALGLGAIGALAVHTGGRLGAGLNAWLMSVFLVLVLAGVAAGTLVALEHRLSPVLAKRLRGGLTWAHILAFWPLPVLLGFHVLKTYYF